MLHAMIMAGGSGTRFWPASRNAMPKQLLNLAGEATMIQATVRRLGTLVPADRLLIVTNQRLVEPIARQLPDLPPLALIGEPCKRDTAPAIGLAAAVVLKHDPKATLVVMPADHVIRPDDVFQQAITQAARLVDANHNLIVTFGIRPTYAAESFGYVERGEAMPTGNGAPVYHVVRFREKPNAEIARQYVESGQYYWNSGIFVWKARTILDALAQFEPEMYGHVARIAEAIGTGKFPEVLQSEFEAIQGKSIDYAVMEHYDSIAVVEAPFEWDDLGSWQALARLHAADDQGNTLVGQCLSVRTANSIIRSSDDHLVATIGVQNIIVVHTPDATLVVNKDDEEAVREIVKLIQQEGWEQYL